jgi:hypothetical protein
MLVQQDGTSSGLQLLRAGVALVLVQWQHASCPYLALHALAALLVMMIVMVMMVVVTVVSHGGGGQREQQQHADDPCVHLGLHTGNRTIRANTQTLPLLYLIFLMTRFCRSARTVQHLVTEATDTLSLWSSYMP